MPRRRLACLAALPLLLAACGGGGDDDTQSRSEVIQDANRFCKQAEAKTQAYAAGRSAPQGDVQVRAALQEDVDIADATVKQLQGLDPAEEQKADFERFVSGLRGIADGNRLFIKAIADNDNAGAKEASAQAVEAAGKAKRGADAYGLDDCPYETVSVQFSQQEKAAAEQVAAAQDPIGSWSGTVTQFGPGAKRSRYRALMTIRDVDTIGARAGAINYPAFPCGGNLELISRRGNRFTFLEHITAHPNTCPSGGRIRSTVNGDSMGWRWVRKDIVVLGTLRRG